MRSKATDLMDRLDALKERLKLLPATDPDFQVPMDGETLELYNALQATVGKLWDRWLQVMDTLDKAQKLSGATSSPFQRKKLLDAEALLDQKGVFEEIEAQSQACVSDMDRLNQAHESARGLVQAIGEAKTRLDTQLAAVEKLGLPTAPYQDDLTAIVAGTTQAGTRLTADPIGAGSALEEIRSRRGAPQPAGSRRVAVPGRAESRDGARRRQDAGGQPSGAGTQAGRGRREPGSLPRARERGAFAGPEGPAIGRSRRGGQGIWRPHDRWSSRARP